MVRANALDYGVPQKRKRVFFLGSKKEFDNEEPKKTHYDPSKPDLFNNSLKFKHVFRFFFFRNLSSIVFFIVPSYFLLFLH